MNHDQIPSEERISGDLVTTDTKALSHDRVHWYPSEGAGLAGSGATPPCRFSTRALALVRLLEGVRAAPVPPNRHLHNLSLFLRRLVVTTAHTWAQMIHDSVR